MPNRVLVVDDLSISRVILRARLSAACYDTLLAHSGQEALDLARRELPDLVLMHCGLPDLDGAEVCRMLRADPRTWHIPVILFSAQGSRANRLAALAAGADDFLVRPLDENYLLSRLRALLRRSALERDYQGQETPALRAGLADAVRTNARSGRVGLVEPEGGSASDIAAPIDMRIAMSDALNPPQQSALPDVFLLAPEIIGGQGLAIISELQSRPMTRQIPIVAILPQDMTVECGMVLDLGAEIVLRLPLDPEETRLRLDAVIRRKTWADALRLALGAELDLASRDALTGLFNRRHALSRLTEMIEGRADTPARHFALLMIDLDNFKQVNDLFGHLSGDAVLTEVAARMASAVRSDDLLARFGGEEFLLALPGLDALSARAMAEQIRSRIESAEYRTGPNNTRLRITASIGVSVHDGSQQASAEPVSAQIQRLIDQADQALHTAKSSGRNRVALGFSAVA
ncbi:diguanylate cyclase [Natronohydrobacter thiooxidans]|uniref:diguanylate cyclase n=1 Tax=Natronohydrobacter thiooxidans TaxID=87172 RepID=UPI0008FF3256|nr:diguanylate cyclase [Natronohydrobacter thiooxidans]